MKNLTILSLTLSIVFSINARAEEYTAAQGMAKLKANVNTAKKNKEEIDRNLQVVNANMLDIKKTKDAALGQKKSISNEIGKNSDALKKVNQQEKELQALQESEKEKLKAEEKQLQQLQALMDQIKKNQEQRQAIIADYQSQLALVSGRKTDWKEREQKLKSQEAQTDEALRKIASEESTWSTKKSGYEKDLKRWSAEAGRTQRIQDTYQGITEGK